MYPSGEATQYGQYPVAMAPANQAEQQEVDTEMGPSVMIMKPILRFLQLLCENHNHDLQVRYCFICFYFRSLHFAQSFCNFPKHFWQYITLY